MKESGGALPPRRMGDHINNSLSPAFNDREQLGQLAGDDPNAADDEDALSPHLSEPAVTPEDCFGPVPPTAPDPYAQQDPFTRDVGPLPSSPFKR